MKGFLLGLLVAGLAFAGYVYVQRSKLAPPAPVASAPSVPLEKAKPKKRKRGAASLVHKPASKELGEPPGLPPEPEPVTLSAADLRAQALGDDVSRPEVTHLDMSASSALAELEQDDIDTVYRPSEPAILDCIAQARPDAEVYIPGKVTVKFKITREGRVPGVQVVAPSILQKGGLYGCIKGVVGRLRFRASSSGQVVTYPYVLS